MKVTIGNKREVKLNNLHAGDFFEYEKKYFLKIADGGMRNVFCLANNEIYTFFGTTIVKRLDGELTIYE